MVYRTAAVTRVLDGLVGSVVLRYGRFTIFLLLHTHTHTHTHTSCTSVFKSRPNTAFLSLQRLWFDLCPASVRSVMFKVAFGEFFCSSTLVFSCSCCILSILIWHAAVTGKSGLYGGRGGPDYLVIRITEG